MDNFLELRGIDKSFYGVKVLNNLDFTIGRGEGHALIGENGCGKSTMIKIISGIYTYENGTMIINGKEYKKITPLEAMKEGIQVIYQDFSLLENMTVAENIMISRAVSQGEKWVHWKGMRGQAEKIIASIGGSIPCDALVEDLTVSQKQMVAICRALAQDAKLLIMDEPTTALTYREVNALFSVVEGLLKRGISVLFISHKLDEIDRISQRITIMRNGKNVYDGSGKDLTREQVIFHMTGRNFRPSGYEPVPFDQADTLLRVEGLTREPFFRNIDLKLEKGEILGITGLLGCGRAELARSLFGLLPAESGRIHIHGEETVINSVKDAMDHNIGYVPEERIAEGLYMSRSIGENMIVCVLDELTTPSGLLDKEKVRQRKLSAMHRLQVSGMELEKEVRFLSGGNQQKILLIKWLEASPDILILNCPTVGVDVGSKEDIHQIIKEIAREGIGVIVISDDIPEIVEVTNRVIIMKEGEIVSEVHTRDTNAEKLGRWILGEDAAAQAAAPAEAL